MNKTYNNFHDSVIDYPLELKGSPDGFESVTSQYKNIREDDARHIPHASGKSILSACDAIRIIQNFIYYIYYDAIRVARRINGNPVIHECM